MRWNHWGYGWEGNRAHTHNTRKAYTNKAQVFERVCEKERCMGKPESTPSHKANKCTRGRLTHWHTRKRLTTHMEDKISNAFVIGEVHGKAQTLPYHKTHKHKYLISLLDVSICVDDSLLCPKPPWYKHKWFVQHHGFLASNNGLWWHATLIFVRVGLFSGMDLGYCTCHICWH